MPSPQELLKGLKSAASSGLSAAASELAGFSCERERSWQENVSRAVASGGHPGLLAVDTGMNIAEAMVCQTAKRIETSS